MYSTQYMERRDGVYIVEERRSGQLECGINADVDMMTYIQYTVVQGEGNVRPP